MIVTIIAKITIPPKLIIGSVHGSVTNAHDIVENAPRPVNLNMIKSKPV